MSAPDYDLALLGKSLSALSPLITAALQILDKPGTRALRRKIDGEFNLAVHTVGTMQRRNTPECDWHSLQSPRYTRATVVWPAGESPKIKAKAAAKAKADAAPPAPIQRRGLQLVVDNGRLLERRASSTPQDQGDAA